MGYLAKTKLVVVEHRWLVGVLLLGVVLNTLEIGWGLPAMRGRPWDIDSIAPNGPLGFASGYFIRIHETFYAAYPLLHYMISAVLYAPYMLLVLLSGGVTLPAERGYPFGLENADQTLTVLTLISRFASVAMASGIVLIWYRIASKLFDRTAGVVAAFLTTTGFAFIYYAQTGNLDVPYLFWTSLALFHLVSIQKGDGKRPYLWFGVFSALAMATKDQAYGFFVFPFLYLIYDLWAKAALPRFKNVFRDVKTRQLFGGFVGAFVLGNNILLTPDYFVRHIRFLLAVVFESRYAVTESFIERRLDLPFSTFDSLVADYGIPLLGIPLVLLGFFSLARWVRPMSLLLLSGASYFATWLFVFGVPVDRYTLGLFLITNVAIGYTVSRWIRNREPARLVVLGAVCALLVVSAFHLPRLLANDSRYDAEQFLQSTVTLNDVIWNFADANEGFGPRLPSARSIHFDNYEDWLAEEGRPLPAADVIVLTYIFPPSEFNSGRLFEQLSAADSGFTLVYHARKQYFFDTGTLRAANPWVYIFRRT